MKAERFFTWVCSRESRVNGIDKRIFIDEKHAVSKEVTTYYNVITGEVFSGKMIVEFKSGEQKFLNENDLFNFLYPL